MKSITPDDFFKQVAIDSGINDIQTTRDFFFGMIKTIKREIRDKHVINLPDWGEFVLQVYPERNYRDVSDGKIKKLPPKPVVKFKPDLKTKKYFYVLGS